jgi:hypothetical protein
VLRTKSIRSISLVPTAGESSPTSVLVDVTTNYPNGVQELKRFQGYGQQLLLPEEMIYGNDLIKVWSIEEEEEPQMMGSENHQATMIRPRAEDRTYNEVSPVFTGKETPTEKKSATPVLTLPKDEMETDDDESPLAEMDDLFMALPPASISLQPRMFPLSPPSTMSRTSSDGSTFSSNRTSSGSTNTIVLDNMLIDDSSLDEEIIPPTTKPPKGHRRGHRRHQSHFDFQFSG